jgi:sugar O-acyltransferase (sialic acid O-acetyltransferase NeuD family)
MGLRKVVVFGTGGTSIDIVDTLHDLNAAGIGPRYECVAFLDDNPALWGTTLAGVPVIGSLATARQFADCYFVNGIGSDRNFRNKPDLIAASGVPDERFVTLIHPTASVSRTARIGRGTVILQQVTVTSNVRIGDHVVILPQSIISHDDVIGDYTCITGGVCLSGNVRVGRCCYLGTRSAIKNGVDIGDGSLVGMGSVVIRSVPANSVVVGNPARYLRPVVDVPRPLPVRA